MPSVLFVCTANRFRSPVAAAVLERCLQELGLAQAWQVRSAGTWTQPGRPVVAGVVEAAGRLGLDLSRHRSAEVDRKLLSASDLILVMESGQKEALLTEFPHLHERIHMLSEVVEGRSYDIPDFPAMAPEADEVVEVVEELNGLIRQGLGPICALAGLLNSTGQKSEIRDG